MREGCLTGLLNNMQKALCSDATMAKEQLASQLGSLELAPSPFPAPSFWLHPVLSGTLSVHQDASGFLLPGLISMEVKKMVEGGRGCRNIGSGPHSPLGMALVLGFQEFILCGKV